MQGRIHSFQSLGTLDGPGVRAVVFMQGCPLRCVCCHNPDTWDMCGGEIKSTDEIFSKIVRLRPYFGTDGGVTVSGGEPLVQAEFTAELFSLCRAAGIHTALDTSGCIYNEQVEKLLDLTDLVLLDYKYMSDTDYKEKCGCEKSKVDFFLSMLEKKGIPVWLRQVIIPTLNDSEDDVKKLFLLEEQYSVVQKTELLPFCRLCVEKYAAMGIPFPLADIPEATREQIDRLYRLR